MPVPQNCRADREPKPPTPPVSTGGVDDVTAIDPQMPVTHAISATFGNYYMGHQGKNLTRKV